jgi:hypothetical protein
VVIAFTMTVICLVKGLRREILGGKGGGVYGGVMFLFYLAGIALTCVMLP